MPGNDDGDRAARLTDLHAQHGPALMRFLTRLTNGAVHHGRSIEEIAQRLKVPAGTVRSRAFYAMRAIRADLKDEV